MTDAILIFTFSPVQSFIVEARRAADLYTGSQILVELARAAGEAIGSERLIYPASLAADVPNKLVARVSWDDCETLADAARKALIKRWGDLAQEARDEFSKFEPPSFDQSIWQRQIANAYLWETWWSAAHLLEGHKYQDAYVEAEQGLIAAKFTRPFEQALEPGFKDTLSGKRQALCAKNSDGNAYWLTVGQIEKITPIKIRPSTDTRPRERLDSIGLIKRFHPELAKKAVKPFHGFPSTSSIASASFMESACEKALDELKIYRNAITALLPDKKYKIRDDECWPYDGDLFYPETLRPKRLAGDYGKGKLTANDPALLAAQKALNELYSALKKAAKIDPSIFTRPSPYYAIIVLDGDGMGEHLHNLRSAEAHRSFSASLGQFADRAKEIAKEHRAAFIYNGGDDVLAMAPLDTAFSFTRLLSHAFRDSTTGITASAGIAIAHHLSPLSHALQTARRAEHDAKQLDGKNAICVIALKRSGEPIEVRSQWEAVGEIFETLITQFQNDEISSKLPYDVARSAYGLPAPDEKLESELKRLLKRHGRTKDFRDNRAELLAESMRLWASTFPKDTNHTAENQPADQLADWLALARFVAKGGRE